MNNHYDLTDYEIVDALKSGELPPNIFSHEAHLRVAWLHIRKYGLDEARQLISNLIKDYVAYIGQEDKFNLTLTIAAVEIVNHFMQKSAADSFPDFIKEFPRLLSSFKELINYHYSDFIYTSAFAKSKYLQPDLQPFC